MKLLRVGIHNLNSLRGTQAVDFRREPLVTNGLYAIVGPTGAGKTTILDAITLALYGRTERDRYGNEVMSHGAGTCFAEVEFVTDEGQFLSRWERRRARNKPDGKLQTAERLLSAWNVETEQYEPLAADKLQEVNERTEALLGLDYDRFVRSVMLTQGQFARFLNSDVKNRSEVLEKITGTEIYTAISEAAFERHKLAISAYEELERGAAGNVPLGAEERGALEEKLRLATERVLHLRPRQKELTDALAQYAQLERMTLRAEEERLTFTAVKTAWRERAGDRKRLAESEAFRPLRRPLREWDQIQAERQKLRSRVDQESKILRESQELAEKTDTAFADVSGKWEKFTGEKPSKEATLERAATLEQTIASTQGTMGAERKRADSLKQQSETLAREHRQLGEDIARIQQSIGEEKHAELAEELATLEQDLPAREREREQARNWTILEAVREEAEKLQKGLEEAKAAVLAREKALAAAEKEMETRQHMLQTLEKNQVLEQHRRELSDGEPCPLCGATEHHTHAFPELDDRARTRAAEDVRSARATRTTAASALTVARQSLGERRADFAAVTARRTEAERRVEGNPPKEADLKKKLRVLEESIPKDRVRLAHLRRVREAIGQLREKEIARKQLRERKEAMAKELTELTESTAKLENTLRELRREHEGLIGNRSVAECRQLLTEREKKIWSKYLESRKMRDAAREQFQRREASLNALREQLSETSKNLELRKAELDAAMADTGANGLDQVRKALLSAESEDALRQSLKELEQKLRAAEGGKERMEKELLAQKTLVGALPSAVELRTEAQQIEQRVSALDQEIGGWNKELDLDDQKRKAQEKIAGQLDALRKEREKWAKLHELIGQKDGTKFRRFAQTLTLQRLVAAGNLHLATISGRYRMRHRAAEKLEKELLELEIIDTYQNDNVRPMSTLSGGETFIVSLALALGLSDLAAGKQLIQSLFIDEGFGTLDEKILDQAMTTLEQLRARGKSVGLISHVKELRERVSCQIRLEPSGNGFSTIRVVG